MGGGGGGYADGDEMLQGVRDVKKFGKHWSRPIAA